MNTVDVSEIIIYPNSYQLGQKLFEQKYLCFVYNSCFRWIGLKAKDKFSRFIIKFYSTGGHGDLISIFSLCLQFLSRHSQTSGEIENYTAPFMSHTSVIPLIPYRRNLTQLVFQSL